jgi:hypothetical protein
VAHKEGQVSQDVITPQFFASRADLYIARADWHVIYKWDFSIEERLLSLPDAHDRRSGSLVGLYRQVDNNIKLGVGYNFTNFSDDLTNLSYKYRGVFLNLVGTM